VPVVGVAAGTRLEQSQALAGAAAAWHAGQAVGTEAATGTGSSTTLLQEHEVDLVRSYAGRHTLMIVTHTI
jgi:hypothetical protein